MTSTDISNAIASVEQYGGQVIAYPNGTYKGQCTVVAYDYVKTLCGITPPYMADDSAQGWGLSFPDTLAPYFTHTVYSENDTYPEGTMFLWNSPHIAVATQVKQPGNTGEVLEQNADPDGSPVHVANRTFNESAHTCTYALVPIIQAPVVAPPDPVVTPPAAPVTIPSSKTPYVIIKTIPGYTTATRAGNHTPPDGDTQISMGSYYIFNTYSGNSNLVNVTKVLGKPGAWINKADNVDTPAPPLTETTVVSMAPTPSSTTPPDWRTSYQAYSSPVTYVCMEEDDITISGKPAIGYMVKDISGAQPPKPLRWTQEIPISGEFTKNGQIYFRPQAATAKLLWYGIPDIDPPIIEEESVIYDPSTTTATRQVADTLTFHDYEVLVVAWVQKIVDKIKGIWS
jgi:hypothetical protein